LPFGAVLDLAEVASCAHRTASPGVFDVIQTHEAVVAVDEDTDGVEAQIAGVRAGRVVFQPSAREAALTCSLAVAQAFQRRWRGAVACSPAHPARLNLDERNRGAVGRDNVDLAIAGAVVAVEDREAEAFQVGDGKALAEAPEDAARVLWALRPRAVVFRTLGRRIGAGWGWVVNVVDACKASSALGTVDADAASGPLCMTTRGPLDQSKLWSSSGDSSWTPGDGTLDAV
jgi:hypothetical protein